MFRYFLIFQKKKKYEESGIFLSATDAVPDKKKNKKDIPRDFFFTTTRILIKKPTPSVNISTHTSGAFRHASERAALINLPSSCPE